MQFRVTIPFNKSKFVDVHLRGCRIKPTPYECRNLHVSSDMFNDIDIPIRYCKFTNTGKYGVLHFNIFLLIPINKEIRDCLFSLNSFYSYKVVYDHHLEGYIAIKLTDYTFTPDFLKITHEYNEECPLKDILINTKDLTDMVMEDFRRRCPYISNIKTIEHIMKFLKPEYYKRCLKEVFRASISFPKIFTNLSTTKYFPYMNFYTPYEDYQIDTLTSTINYFMDEALIQHPEAIDYIDKAYSLFKEIIDNDEHKTYKQYLPVTKLSREYGYTKSSDSLDILMRYLRAGYVQDDFLKTTESYPLGIHCYYDKLYYYVPNVYIDTRRVLEKFPDIINDVEVLSRWFNNIMPYAVRLRLISYIDYHNKSTMKDRVCTCLIDLGRIISLWVCTCEAGTGSNAWLLHHPMTSGNFEALRRYLLNWSYYQYFDSMMISSIVKIETYITGIEDPPKELWDSRFDMVKDVIKLFDTDFNLDDIINWTLEFINKYKFITTLDKWEYGFDEYVHIPSPSGFTFKPWYVRRW